MKLISWNVNGLRAVYKKGFQTWMESETPDVVCLQEIKAMREQMTEDEQHPLGYHSYWNSAQKPGYSGTAIYSKTEPHQVFYGIGVPEIDSEGRVLTAEYAKFFIVNCYFPNSQPEHTRLGYKLAYCAEIQKYLDRLKTHGKAVILCGDLNIAHQDIDLRNPKTNRDTSGFLPEERAWLDSFLKHGYVDGFRRFHAEPDQYTWWSYRLGVRAKNIGWRIDYFIVNQESADFFQDVLHRPEVMGSDHCPVELLLKD